MTCLTTKIYAGGFPIFRNRSYGACKPLCLSGRKARNRGLFDPWLPPRGRSWLVSGWRTPHSGLARMDCACDDRYARNQRLQGLSQFDTAPGATSSGNGSGRRNTVGQGTRIRARNGTSCPPEVNGEYFRSQDRSVRPLFWAFVMDRTEAGRCGGGARREGGVVELELAMRDARE